MSKVVLVGAGMVGISYAFALVNQGFVNELSIIDLDKDLVKGHVLDLQHGLAYAPNQMRIKEGDYSDCADADIVCICAGANQKPGQTRLELIDTNVNILHKIVSDVQKSGFNGIYLIASNPVDVLAYATHKFTGLDASRCIGSGTTLDSARLQFGIAQVCDYAPSSVNAYTMGEHGNSVVSIWSNANAAGLFVTDEFKKRGLDPQEQMDTIHADVRDAAARIIDVKGSTYFGIAMSLARITRAIFQNENAVLPVSTLLTGQYGQNGVYASVPTVINKHGVASIIEAPISDEERQKLDESCKILKEFQDSAVDNFSA